MKITKDWCYLKRRLWANWYWHPNKEFNPECESTTKKNNFNSEIFPTKKSVWLTLAQTPYLVLKQSETVCLLTTGVTRPQSPPPKHIPCLPTPLHPSCGHQQTQTTSSGGRPVSSSQLAYFPTQWPLLDIIERKSKRSFGNAHHITLIRGMLQIYF